MAAEAVTSKRNANTIRLPRRRVSQTFCTWSILLAVLTLALANNLSLAARLREHDRRWTTRTGVPMRMLPGHTDVFVSDHYLNRTLPEDAYVWLVGDAAVFYVDRRMNYTVPFSRDPWLEFAAAGAGPHEALDWLRDRGVTHLAFSWSEIERLRRTYGFTDVVTPTWVARLERAGLQSIDLDDEAAGAAGIVIYELRPKTAP
jgi:hypothetical protein